MRKSRQQKERRSMSTKAIATNLTKEQLRDGFLKTTNNAHRLLSASLSLVAETPELSLGLAEVGQEELGKSLSLLASFILPTATFGWEWLWRGWKDHRLKGHRAFLYELVSPVRIEMHGANGLRMSGIPSRDQIQHEKEFSFYVNFQPESGKFVSPRTEVELREAANRVMTLFYLSVTASAIEKALEEADSAFRYDAFSEIAIRICSENLHQQDMPSIYAEFESRSPKHQLLMEALGKHLSAGRDDLLNIFAKTNSQPQELQGK